MSDKALPLAGPAATRAPAKVSRSLTIPRVPVNPGRIISNLYYNILSLKLKPDPMALQFLAPNSRAGTSLVASQFAAFASSLTNGSVLLVDCMGDGRGDYTGSSPQQSDALRRSPSLTQAYSEDGHIDRAIVTVGPIDSPYLAILGSPAHLPLQHDGKPLADLLQLARKRYALVVLDTPSVEESASTLLFSRACDGVVLVLEAEATPIRSAEATLEDIERSGGKVLGTVFNKRRMHMPRWLFRRL
jgi:Mrp family chromosome partitioning ATPase